MAKKVRVNRKTPKYKRTKTINEYLAREKEAKKLRKALKAQNLTKDKNDLIKDLVTYTRYASTRILALNALEKYLEDHPEINDLDKEKLVTTRDTFTQINSEFQSAIDICNKMSTDNPEDMLEALSVLSSTVVGRLSQLGELDEQYKALVTPYASEITKMIIDLNREDTPDEDTVTSNFTDDEVTDTSLEVKEDGEEAEDTTVASSGEDQTTTGV